MCDSDALLCLTAYNTPLPMTPLIHLLLAQCSQEGVRNLDNGRWPDSLSFPSGSISRRFLHTVWLPCSTAMFNSVRLISASWWVHMPVFFSPSDQGMHCRRCTNTFAGALRALESHMRTAIAVVIKPPTHTTRTKTYICSSPSAAPAMYPDMPQVAGAEGSTGPPLHRCIGGEFTIFELLWTHSVLHDMLPVVFGLVHNGDCLPIQQDVLFCCTHIIRSPFGGGTITLAVSPPGGGCGGGARSML